MTESISVCYITRDESELLQKSLASLKPFGFELVVVDTGSMDDTLRMAREYTDSVYEFTWIDDFSAARNYSIRKASFDKVLVVDSDEFYLEGDVEQFLYSVYKYGNAVGEIHIKNNILDKNGSIQERITECTRSFDRRLFHFEGLVHEQVIGGSVFDVEVTTLGVDSESEATERVSGYDTGLLFEHVGYAGADEIRRKKAARNVSLLKKRLERNPDSALLLYQMAKSIYVSEGIHKSICFYEKALACDLDPDQFWVRDLIIGYGYTLLELQEYEKALSLEAVYEELRDRADYLFLMGLIHMNNGFFDLASKEFIRCTTLDFDSSVGTNSFKAFYNAGVIEEGRGNISKAIELYKKAGEYEPAKQGLLRCLNR